MGQQQPPDTHKVKKVTDYYECLHCMAAFIDAHQCPQCGSRGIQEITEQAYLRISEFEAEAQARIAEDTKAEEVFWCMFDLGEDFQEG